VGGRRGAAEVEPVGEVYELLEAAGVHRMIIAHRAIQKCKQFSLRNIPPPL
jgi:hypothetical protein